ncbi:hypothetical protein [Streptomyces sp. NPDC087859]|uniref:hypothetical protein n=1 Tax=Streptomyces sp. NPDC087859 TaxID=3365812 RepID=UPI0038258C8D
MSAWGSLWETAFDDGRTTSSAYRPVSEAGGAAFTTTASTAVAPCSLPAPKVA